MVFEGLVNIVGALEVFGESGIEDGWGEEGVGMVDYSNFEEPAFEVSRFAVFFASQAGRGV